jgi:hypothetical protein
MGGRATKVVAIARGQAAAPQLQTYDVSAILGVRVAVEFGVQAANRFDLGG